jgi:integrase
VDRLIISKIARHIEQYGSDSPLLITGQLGRPVNRSRFQAAWRSAVEQAGLPAGTRYHDLRHAYVALLISAGVHPRVIQQRCGHSSIVVTMDVYGSLYDDADDAGAGVIETAFTNVHAASARGHG